MSFKIRNPYAIKKNPKIKEKPKPDTRTIMQVLSTRTNGGITGNAGISVTDIYKTY